MRVRDRSDEFNWLISRIEDYLCFLRNNVLDEDKEELCEKFEIALRSLGDYKLDEDLKLYNENKKIENLNIISLLHKKLKNFVNLLVLECMIVKKL